MNERSENQAIIQSDSMIAQQLKQDRTDYEQISEYVWRVANLSTTAFLTSVGVVAVQSPIKTLLTNIAKTNAILPGVHGGALGLVKTLYAGTIPSLSGSTVRTAYVTTAKNGRPIEEPVLKESELSLEQRKGVTFSVKNMGYVASMAFGDVLVTQISESLSLLKKVPNLLPKDFNWKQPHNVYQLMSGGFAARYATGMINFASLCLLEEKLAASLPFEDKKLAHFTAGAFSGMIAAFWASPFSGFKDYVLVQAQVNQGLLYNRSSFTVAKELLDSFKQAPLDSLKSLGAQTVKQVPLRMGLTGAIFATVAVIQEVVGNEPLNAIIPDESRLSVGNSSHGFFSRSTERTAERVSSPDYVMEPLNINF